MTQYTLRIGKLVKTRQQMVLKGSALQRKCCLRENIFFLNLQRLPSTPEHFTQMLMHAFRPAPCRPAYSLATVRA